LISLAIKEKTLVDEIKGEWKKLWNERLDDKVRAEGIAVGNYQKLFVDKGTVIHATRNYKPLDLKDILKQHQLNSPKNEPTNPHIGGWNKFVKTQIINQKPQITIEPETKVQRNQPKKGGRGWLHK
jgi:hypothetical protein